jgi:hypothetical protein
LKLLLNACPRLAAERNPKQRFPHQHREGVG